MKILQVHNYYQQPGGEDQVFAAEGELLGRRGHTVFRFEAHNDDVAQYGRLALAKATVWNDESYERLRALLREHRPQILHVHNTLPLISPAAYYAAKREGVAVVQTLHNYRLLCPAATFFRDGHVCEDCLGKAFPWPAVAHACYRDRAASSVVASMLAYHRARHTWRDAVDAYIALTPFSKEKFVEGGLPENKIFVKPNFLGADPGAGAGSGGYALFVGRLTEEKGLGTLLDAWTTLGAQMPLKIAGDGPLSPEVSKRAQTTEGVTWLGRQPREEVLALMKSASLLVFPSTWYEGFPVTLVEALAVGLPVVASNVGSMASLIDHERTGLHFRAGDAADLAEKVAWALAHPAQLAHMRKEARAEYLNNYTADQNYQQLMDIYERALTSQTKSA